MEWRCEWCGKPHEENDPPCDNCGHGTFEKAVVPVPESEPEKTTTVWVCADCGREHPKHSPPCSRCGGHELEKREQEVDDDELTAPSYFDLVTPRYVAAFAGVLVLAGVFALGVTGVVDLPGFGPSVPDAGPVPGNATAAGDIALADVEEAYLRTVNEQRRAAGVAPLTRKGALDRAATYLTKTSVKIEYANGSRPSLEPIRKVLQQNCRTQPRLVNRRFDGSDYESAEALGAELARTASAGQTLLGERLTRTGIDLHVGPDGAIFLTQIAC